MRTIDRSRTPPFLDDDDISIDDFRSDDEYRGVVAECEEKGKFEEGYVCYDDYKCSWLHTLDSEYKCQLGNDFMVRFSTDIPLPQSNDESVYFQLV